MCKKMKQAIINTRAIINLIIFSILILFYLTSCGDDDETPSAIYVYEEPFEIVLLLINEDGEEVTTFNENELITFELSITNMTNYNHTFYFSTGRQYDFNIYNENEELIWCWGKHRPDTDSPTELLLEPHELKIITETWNQEIEEGGLQIEEGVLLDAGNYMAEGIITSGGQYIGGCYDSPYTSSKVDFTLQR
jgi:hypothetical protein